MNFSDKSSSLPRVMAGLSFEDYVENSEAGDVETVLNDMSCEGENLHGVEVFGGFIGTSYIMQKLYERIEAAATSQATVFITGESGTGKEVCAEAIHKYSCRASGPFVPVNCAAIPRDLMESELFGHVKGAFTGAIAAREGAVSLANGGTLFLDEVAEMTPDMQTKLLRFLQDFTFRKVGCGKLEKTDIRVICATNRDPVAEIKSGRFREDLFYRLHVVPIFMPPLCQRGDDVIDIAHVLMRRYAEEEGKQFEVMEDAADVILKNYHWPGNIRQLQNIVRNAVVMNDGKVLMADMLPMTLFNKHHVYRSALGDDAENSVKPLALVEREAIEKAIDVFNGNVPAAATALGVSASTLYRKKAAWGESAL